MDSRFEQICGLQAWAIRSFRAGTAIDPHLRRALYVAYIDFVATGILTSGSTVEPQASKRTELSRGDFAGTNMEMVVSLVEVPPGASGLFHTHTGDEAYYVVEGTPAEWPDGTSFMFNAGTSRINVRDMPHAAFKNTGDKTLRLLTVHLADKGEPRVNLTEP